MDPADSAASPPSAVSFGMAPTRPVTDWTTDYDILDDDYVADPYPIWDDLRQQCPIAHSDRWGGSWLPTRYVDVASDRPRRGRLQLE